MSKQVLLTAACVAAIGITGYIVYNKMPKASIDYDKTKKAGTLHLGSKSAAFDLNTLATGGLKSWNGYELNLTYQNGKAQYTLKRGSVVFTSGILTGYDAGSTYLKINNT